MRCNDPGMVTVRPALSVTVIDAAEEAALEATEDTDADDDDATDEDTGATVAGAFVVAGAAVDGIGVAVGAGTHAAKTINTRAMSPIEIFRIFILSFL